MQTWIDISAYDGMVNWQRMVDTGISAATVRATIGGLMDERWERNILEADKVGIEAISYHFYIPYASRWWTNKKLKRLTPEQQAYFFGATLAGLSAKNTMLDVESKSVYGIALYKGIWKKEILPFYKIHTPNYVYTNPDGLSFTDVSDHWITQAKLVIAHYKTAFPQVGLPFNPFKWTAWQYTAKADGPYYGSEAQSVSLYVTNPIWEVSCNERIPEVKVN